jgi:predicted MFS family arabinose efflux permease
VAAVSALVPSIAKDLGIAEFITGKIIWAYMLPYGVCALFYGPLTRKFAIRDIQGVCLLLFTLFSFLSGFAGSFNALFTARFLVGVFAGAMTPLTLVYISHNFGIEERGRVIGKFFSLTFISSLAGLFLSGIIHWRWIFYLSAMLGALTVILIYALLPKLKVESADMKSRYLEALANQKFFRVFAYIFLISFLFHAAQQWLGVYFDSRYHLSQFIISMLLTLVSFAGIFGEFIGGHMSDKKGRVTTLTKGAFLMAASLLLLIFVKQTFILALIMLCWGLGWTINHAGLSTYLTDLPKPYLREASSLNSSVRFISGGLGTALGGALMQRSFNLTFISIGAVIFLMAFASHRILK